MEFFGTIGPACGNEELLASMMSSGMTALRWNLSHGGPEHHPEWLTAFERAKQRMRADCGLVLDLQGAELRCGNRAELTLREAECISAEQLGLPSPLLSALRVGDCVRLDDGKCLLRAEQDGLRVLRGGLLPPGKSAAIEGREIALPPLTAQDRQNLRAAAGFGITGVMASFTRSAEDLFRVRAALDETGMRQVRVIAKIEDGEGLAHAAEIVAACDALCVARGDLGNRYALERVPEMQKRLTALCVRAGKPCYIATQLLASMERQPTPTRAEMNDVFNGVLDGASGFFLTGETAAGRYPAEAMAWLVRCARRAEQYRQTEE